MSSNIDVAVPPFGSATTAGVRANFLAAKDEILALQNCFGFANYHDLETNTAPIALTANVWSTLTNDAAGSLTLNKLPSDVATLWNATTDRFDFTDLPLYSQMTGRFDITITTAGNNQDIDVQALVGIGSSSAYSFPLMTQHRFATAGTHQVNIFNGMYIGSSDIQNYPAAIQIRSTGIATVKVAGWYLSIVKPTF